MSLLQSQPWEVRLLRAATEALDSQKLHITHPTDQSVMATAYDYCEQMTRVHSRTFFVASSLLTEEKRQAVRALYAFCRITDDIVDEPQRTTEQRLSALHAWESTIMATTPDPNSLVSLAWTDTQTRFHIPRGYAQQLIDGCARDIAQARYETFADLAEYSYGVASTVGLMAMHIIGFEGEEALPYAVRLGVALQLTNILRDVGEDWQNGRLYLPQDELKRFGVTEEQIAAKHVNDQWRRFMAFQIERTRQLYAESLPGIAMLAKDGRFAIAAAARLYEAVLKDIEAHDYNVFARRAHVSTMGKLVRLPRIWWQARTASIR
ncbi:phytoene/squalene synthase family protein [Phototrophicus methaneseepsis]|uniref:Phytoene/squalene synthase family protein n=1 Tax=Phototrophicus methaneseepsis TaxID=2710758 RepID=A0A7S8IDI6_9CHLR|nr:phytoene/squalene synthase family protein [Phototrophicus methaneseepsis]QPC81404.1 phytoene/squalene synthase family protein [Phototrophicus methaneseepsis]